MPLVAPVLHSVGEQCQLLEDVPRHLVVAEVHGSVRLALTEKMRERRRRRSVVDLRPRRTIFDDLDVPPLLQTNELSGLEIQSVEVVDGQDVGSRQSGRHFRLLNPVLLQQNKISTKCSICIPSFMIGRDRSPTHRQMFSATVKATDANAMSTNSDRHRKQDGGRRGPEVIASLVLRYVETQFTHIGRWFLGR
jgi:hypothetical protein